MEFPAETFTCGKDQGDQSEGVEEVAHVCRSTAESVMQICRERFGVVSLGYLAHTEYQLAAAEMDHHTATGVEHSALGGSERSALAASGPFPDWY